MIRITIGLLLIIGFAQSFLLTTQSEPNNNTLTVITIVMAIGLILIAFGLRNFQDGVRKI